MKNTAGFGRLRCLWCALFRVVVSGCLVVAPGAGATPSSFVSFASSTSSGPVSILASPSPGRDGAGVGPEAFFLLSCGLFELGHALGLAVAFVMPGEAGGEQGVVDADLADEDESDSAAVAVSVFDHDADGFFVRELAGEGGGLGAIGLLSLGGVDPVQADFDACPLAQDVDGVSIWHPDDFAGPARCVGAALGEKYAGEGQACLKPSWKHLFSPGRGWFVLFGCRRSDFVCSIVVLVEEIESSSLWCRKGAVSTKAILFSRSSDVVCCGGLRWVRAWAMMGVVWRYIAVCRVASG